MFNQRIQAKDDVYLFAVPGGEFLAVFPPGASLLPLPEPPVKLQGKTWIKVEVTPGLSGWTRQAAIEQWSGEDSGVDLGGASQDPLKGRPLGMVAFQDALGFYGLSTGMTRTVRYNDVTIDVVGIHYRNRRGEWREVWVNIGWTTPDGVYHPAYLTATDAMETGWTERDESLQFFRDAHYLVHVGFYLAELLTFQPLHLDWKKCQTPEEVCQTGRWVETQYPGASQLFLKGEKTPEDWVAFGWKIFRIQRVSLP